jgi:hypothetical protein
MESTEEEGIIKTPLFSYGEKGNGDINESSAAL